MSNDESQKQNGDSTAVKIVLIVCAVIFGFPLLIAIAAFIFISVNFDRITDWVDRHIDEYENYSVTSPETVASLMGINDAANGVEGVKVSHSDCRNVKNLIGKTHAEAYNFMADVCSEDSMNVSSKALENDIILYFQKDSACLELTFRNNFLKYKSFEFDDDAKSCGDSIREVKFDDSAEEMVEEKVQES